MLFNAKLPVTLNLDLDVPQIDEVSNMCPTSILRNLRKVLGRNQFRQILFSVLTGIQILVRGPKLPTLKSLYSLCSLVPKACRRVQTQSDQYLDSRICNFIGTFWCDSKVHNVFDQLFFLIVISSKHFISFLWEK